MPKERVEVSQPDAILERPRDPVVPRHIQWPREGVSEPAGIENRTEGLRAQRDGTTTEDDEEQAVIGEPVKRYMRCCLEPIAHSVPQVLQARQPRALSLRKGDYARLHAVRAVLVFDEEPAKTRVITIASNDGISPGTQRRRPRKPEPGVDHGQVECADHLPEWRIDPYCAAPALKGIDRRGQCLAPRDDPCTKAATLRHCARREVWIFQMGQPVALVAAFCEYLHVERAALLACASASWASDRLAYADVASAAKLNFPDTIAPKMGSIP